MSVRDVTSSRPTRSLCSPHQLMRSILYPAEQTDRPASGSVRGDTNDEIHIEVVGTMRLPDRLMRCRDVYRAFPVTRPSSSSQPSHLLFHSSSDAPFGPRCCSVVSGGQLCVQLDCNPLEPSFLPACGSFSVSLCMASARCGYGAERRVAPVLERGCTRDKFLYEPRSY